MDARTELFGYLGAAIVTIAVLFTVQHWYASYLDVAVVHAENLDAPMNPKLAAVRAQEQHKLSSSALTIDAAMHALAQRGRQAFPRIAPKPSDDLSAMSGWINRPGFAPYSPRQAPVVAQAVPAEAADATAAGAAAAAPAGQEAAAPNGGKP
jgi:hypothetical protein